VPVKKWWKDRKEMWTVEGTGATTESVTRCPTFTTEGDMYRLVLTDVCALALTPGKELRAMPWSAAYVLAAADVKINALPISVQSRSSFMVCFLRN
jgi:hypothetical protein